MNSGDKLQLVQATDLRMLADQLNEDDRVSIVTYAGSASVPSSLPFLDPGVVRSQGQRKGPPRSWPLGRQYEYPGVSDRPPVLMNRRDHPPLASSSGL